MPGHAQAAFEEAIALAERPNSADYQWYPYSYICGFLMRRTGFILQNLGEDSSSSKQFWHLFFLVPLPVDKGLRQDSQTLMVLVQGIATRWHWNCYEMQGDGLGTKEVILY
jgi:hypothetical protein